MAARGCLLESTGQAVCLQAPGSSSGGRGEWRVTRDGPAPDMAGGEGGGEGTDDHIDWLLLDPKHPDTQVRCEVIGCM